MTDEKWLDLLENLSQKYKLEKENEEIITKDDLGNEMINQIERVIFESPVGKIKLERTTRPMILDKKVHYSHTAGTKGLVEYILSPDEKTHKLQAYRKVDGDWDEIKTSSEGFSI